jgi:nitrate/nitrite transport system ATP-binding protein
MPWLTVRKNTQVLSRWPNYTAKQVNEHVEKYVAMVGPSQRLTKPS